MPRAKAKKSSGPIPVDATKHPGDTRVNIPTAELESFAEDDERKPTTLLYPRDPSLDPQLVWKGKDEQDQADLAVPAVPIYIQESTEPRALVEDLRAQSKGRREEQVSFFEPFEGMEFADRVDFYQHEGKWANRMILGDSLLVMASLAEKEGLKGQVQMMYVDPPYGIKFGSNWQVSTRKRDVRDGKVEDATRQPEQIRAFRDTWELGIHSYLNYLRDRLTVAHELLTQSGSIFVQIGDENVHLVRAVLDEVFGSDNFCGLIAYKTTAGLRSDFLAASKDWICWYARDRSEAKFHRLFSEKMHGEEGATQFSLLESPDGKTILPIDEVGDALDARLDKGWRILAHDNLTSTGFATTTAYEIDYEGKTYRLPRGNVRWKTTPEGMARLVAAQRVMPVGNTLRYKRYLDDFPVFPLVDVWTDTGISGFGDKKLFVVQTNTKVVQRCVLMTTDPGDLILDPTCGSGTAAFVAEEWGRRWITIDTSRVALALARTRLMAARYPYYLLADSSAGQAKEAVVSGHASGPPFPLTQGDVKKGFVYERVPHVTLKSIAQNPEIKEGMARAEIDSVIARHTDNEILYDRPYIGPKVVRVSGPFTVESLSPHRMLDPHAETPVAKPSAKPDSGRFIEHVIENLRKAGVQNTVRDERLAFDRLESWPGGVFIQAAGEYTEKGRTKQVALSIGPEYGTVGTELVREAAKEALRIADLLVVCGFAFEALVGEQSSQLGRLTILKAKMNPDLQMPDLLKKTGAGNLFMVFGEPDLEIHAGADDKLTVEIRGLDVYDPTTGVIRSHSTDDIACWFIDTNYDGESFFVRHAYFLGVDDPYDKLKRALRADIDEEAWATVYRTTSRPFPKPSTGKVAIKVINHYGDEVLRVVQFD